MSEECPSCEEGRLTPGTVREVMDGVDLGAFPAMLCRACGESYVDSKTMMQVETAAKNAGVWGRR